MVWEKGEGEGNHLLGNEERMERDTVIYVRSTDVRREGEE